MKTSEQAWNELQAVPSYVEQQAARFARALVAKRRTLGHSFFYYHAECGQFRAADEYEPVLVSECAPGTTCCGCWGLLHEPPVPEKDWTKTE